MSTVKIFIKHFLTYRESCTEQASRIFLTTDLIGQTYFCYIVKTQFRLYLVRLEKPNEPEQIILGMVTTIAAKDAINLPVSLLNKCTSVLWTC